MFSGSKVTEIYCLADDFCKEFAVQQEKYMIEDKYRPHRNKPNRMSDAEIMVILIFPFKIQTKLDNSSIINFSYISLCQDVKRK